MRKNLSVDLCHLIKSYSHFLHNVFLNFGFMTNETFYVCPPEEHFCTVLVFLNMNWMNY